MRDYRFLGSISSIASALGQNWAKVMAVHRLGHLGAVVPTSCEICSMLQPLALSNDTKLYCSSPKRSVRSTEPGCQVDHAAEGTPGIGGVEFDRCAEHQL